MAESLKERAVSGVLWSSIQKFGISIISFISNIVLARLLTPDDYGCLGLLLIFIAISNALIYGGFISALIQKKNADETDFSTVFYWNLVVSILLYTVLFFAAPAIARYYKIDLLCNVLRVFGVVLIINGLTAVQTTLLRKNLNFRKLAIIGVTSTLISIIVAIVLAYMGFGVWALVFQNVTNSIINSILLWFTSNWRPKLIFSTKSFKGLFGYGCFLLLSDLMNSLCDNIQGLIIGKRFSSSTMGYYTQAKRMEDVPSSSITQLVAQVTFPIYAKVQDDKERLYRAVKNTLALMNYINIPLMVMFIVVARPLFIVLFSDTWIDSIPYFRILCVAGFVNCLQSVNYQVVSASGRSKALFVWNFVKRGSGLVLMLLGALIGVEGILWGMVISFYIIFVINAKLAYKSTSYSMFEQIKDSMPALGLSLAAGAAAFGVSFLFQNVFVLLALQVAVFVAVYLSLSWAFKMNELFEVKQMALNYLSNFTASKKNRAK